MKFIKALPLLLLFMALNPGCSSPEATSDHRPVVTVSILPQQFFIRELAGDLFKVNVMIPPGVEHAHFDPSTGQIKQLEHSSAYFKMGYLGFEKAWLPRIEKNYPELKVFDLSKGITAVNADPHIWLSPKTARTLALNTASALIQTEPACARLIRQKLDSLLIKIDSVDQVFTRKLALLTRRNFIIFHPALTYLARDYQLEQIPMETDGKKPSAAYLKLLVDKAKELDIHTIFVQKEYDQENARVLAKEIRGKIVGIDPMNPNWFGVMKQVLTALTSSNE